MVVNEFFKNSMKKIILNNFLTYMLRQKKIEIHSTMIMIWTYDNMFHSKPFKSS
jgi:hypothetical protein